MEILQAFKFELRPVGAQRRALSRFAGCKRFVYNKALELRKAAFDADKSSIGYCELARLLTAWRADPQTAWLAGAPVHPLQQALKDLDAAYKNRRYYLMSWPTNEYRSDPYLTFGGVAAVALKNEGGSVAWDGELAYSKEQLFWYDPVADTFNPYNAPIYFEQTLTFALGGKKTFIALKQANDIYVDRSMYFGRAMPCLEQWFGEAFAVRAGAEGTLFARDGSMVLGWGATGGLTLRLFGFDLDANYTFRLRPSRTLADTLIPESVLFFTLTKNGIFRR